jgi:uracil permease
MSHNLSTLSSTQKVAVGVQFLFVAFGSTVLVPLLVGMDPSAALFTAGVGTLIFHLVTKGKVPIFLGSSFAFIAPIVKSTQLYGLPGTMSGIAAVGFVYFIMSFLVKRFGIKLINRLFPPVVIGPVIMLIGLSLCSSAVNMAKENWLLAGVSLLAAVLGTIYGKGFVKLVSIFIGVIVGYIVAVCFGLVNFAPVADAAWIEVPKFIVPTFSIHAVLFMIPVAIAPVIEHVGDIYAINAVTGNDYIKDPGLHRTLLGDGLACLAAGFMGGPPVTTYAEVTGAISITKVKDPVVIRIAAFVGISFSVLGKMSALLRNIPNAVIGGIMLLLFGSIAAVGVNTLIRNKTDMSDSRNLIIVSLTLTIGIGGAVLQMGDFTMTGIGLAAIIGVMLNLILPEHINEEKKE